MRNTPAVLVYLASPYSSPDPEVRERRYHEAVNAAVRIMTARRGEVLVFSPIAHGHPMGSRLGLGFEHWREFDRRMISACDEVWILTTDGWKESRGILAEFEIAAEMGKPAWLIREGETRAYRDEIGHFVVESQRALIDRPRVGAA